LKYAAALLIIGGSQLLTSCGGYVATAPPPPPYEVIGVAPSPYHVWVPGYYSYNRGHYVYTKGFYRIPPRGKKYYVQGNWRNTSRGYKRDKGYWR
jgi:hypothetical protein